jgi:hypothetical protein
VNSIFSASWSKVKTLNHDNAVRRVNGYISPFHIERSKAIRHPNAFACGILSQPRAGMIGK